MYVSFIISVWLYHLYKAKKEKKRRVWRYQRGNQNPYVEEEQIK